MIIFSFKKSFYLSLIYSFIRWQVPGWCSNSPVNIKCSLVSVKVQCVLLGEEKAQNEVQQSEDPTHYGYDYPYYYGK